MNFAIDFVKPIIYHLLFMRKFVCMLMYCCNSGKILAISDKSILVRHDDGGDSRLIVQQLQLGKYTIRHATATG